ncbi:MAG: hypothetical protein MRQ10_00670 [Candidatus Midichloria mitochondrii]|nr:hypothetical protein [Candidatus Midichloria mitochondrii]
MDCFILAINLLAVSALTASTKFWLDSWKKALQVFIGLFVSDLALNIAKEIAKYVGNDKFRLCYDYDNYEKINLSSFRLLKQFEKYLLLNKEAPIQ